ncbi:MAG: MFS transporter [Chloroflexi bacterium]|nr:MFS transporter [Chloroflexota bacterium]
MAMMGARRRAVTGGVALGTLLVALNISVVSTVMPTVVASLGGLDLYSWVFMAYLMASTVTTPIAGRLSDLYGRRRLYIAGTALFILGSALCGASQSMEQLILFRAVQGLGGGALLALHFTIIGDVFPPTQRAQVQGLVATVWAVSSVAGPLIGGFIVDQIGWRWVFYLNLVPAALPLPLILVNLVEARRGRPQIDYLGVLFLTTTIIALLLGPLQPGAVWGSLPVFGFSLIAIGSLAAFLVVEGHAAQPLVPLGLFRSRTFTIANVGNFLTGLAVLASPTFIPPFVQGVMGRSATQAGLAMMPMSIGWPLGSLIGGQILNRLGYRNVVTIGMGLMVIGFFPLSRISLNTGFFEIMSASFVAGAGMGLIAPTVITAVQNTVDRSELGIATSLAQFFRQIGGAMGLSVMGSLMAFRFHRALGQLLLPLDPASLLEAGGGDMQAALDPERASQLSAPVRAAFQGAMAEAIAWVFAIALAAVILGLLVGFFMPNTSPLREAKARDSLEESGETGFSQSGRLF